MMIREPAPEKSSQETKNSYSAGPFLGSKLLLSVPETAGLLGISRRTVFLLLASGDLRRRKVRRRTMIHRDDVLQFARK